MNWHCIVSLAVRAPRQKAAKQSVFCSMESLTLQLHGCYPELIMDLVRAIQKKKIIQINKTHILFLLLGYRLADEGFDVWLGNSRGNFYSTNPINYFNSIPRILPQFGKSFWQFSWHEIGFYDLPASIDYVLQTTGKPKLHYVGHSQGTTAFFVMASERPEYNEKIVTMHALAPVAFMTNVKSIPVRIIEPFRSTLQVWIHFQYIFFHICSHSHYCSSWPQYLVGILYRQIHRNCLLSGVYLFPFYQFKFHRSKRLLSRFYQPSWATAMIN